MKREDPEQLLTKTDIVILEKLTKKNYTPKTELHQKIDKYSNRINDRINRLIDYNFIIESDGIKKGSKKIEVNKFDIPLIKLLIGKFLNKKTKQNNNGSSKF